MLYLASCTVLAMQDWPTDFQKNCTVVDNYDTRASMVPKKWPTGLPLNGYSLPMDDPPSVPGATCNFAMPDRSTRDRYLWVMHAKCLHSCFTVKQSWSDVSP